MARAERSASISRELVCSGWADTEVRPYAVRRVFPGASEPRKGFNYVDEVLRGDHAPRPDVPRQGLDSPRLSGDDRGARSSPIA